MIAQKSVLVAALRLPEKAQISFFFIKRLRQEIPGVPGKSLPETETPLKNEFPERLVSTRKARELSFADA
ncbi:MAG TPA: hypothetical protein VND65_17525 [Candidatus Binatia bacterium]|nr:hypothetical protein [Candidatus Binatia bacterium]